MAEHSRFHLEDLQMLRDELAELGLSLPIEEDFAPLSQPLALAGRTVPNRFIVQPMEGFDSDDQGAPGELSLRRYRRYALGGSPLIWFEATAILREARSNPQQLWLHRGSVDAFARLVDATRAAAREAYGRDVLLIVQLTHSGRYSKPAGLPRPLVAHRSPVLDPLHKLPPDYPVLSDAELDALQDVYVEAAGLAARAGFDGVDVKSCHRYLVSELLASHTREGRYGGSLENRSRLLRETMARIRGEFPSLMVTTRMNVFDAIAYPYGFGVDRADPRQPDLTEPIQLIGQLRAEGIPLLNVTIGNPYFNPHYGRPFDHPTAGSPLPPEHPLAGVVRIARIARDIQQSFPDLPVVATGLSWLRHLFPYVAAGMLRQGWASLVGMGRGAFAYPDAPKDILFHGGMDPQKTCIACSGCTQIMRDGTRTGCVIRDSDIYGVEYRLGRRFALDHLQQRARECRDCEFATCTAHCPAAVDVPAFIRAFADGDIATAYDVLRSANVLPEMCGAVCPSEVQCEGGCVERIFKEHAIPIRDIQLMVSRIARREGLTGVRLPAEPSSRRVAVVGGGPAGLACAIRLLELGHQVALFDSSEHLGGTPDDAIPLERFRAAADEVDAILTPARRAERIELHLGAAMGRHVQLADLRRDYDAVFLALGLRSSTSLGTAPGVVDALTFLREAKCGIVRTAGQRVAVLGGGNTALDAATTALRLGAKDVYLVYRRSFREMPAWPAERQQFLDLGGHLLILSQPMGYATDAFGRLAGVRIARTELGDADDSGRRRPVVVPGTELTLPVDLAIEAIGQRVPADVAAALEELERTRGGLVVTADGSQATSLAGVWAGGDLVNGGTTAVEAVVEGMRAAEEIDRYLSPVAADA